MLKKPFKPPGSKDGGEASTGGLSKPFVKPGMKSSLPAQPKPATNNKQQEQNQSDNSKKENQNTEINDQVPKPAATTITKPQGLLGLKGKPFKAVTSSKPDDNAKSATTTGLTKQSTVQETSKTTLADTTNTQDDKNAKDEYFKCFWSKDVKKKHKVLDDGIIVFQGNKVQIYNSDGEKIYDSYKSKLYCPNPDNGDQYIVGSFFVEQDAAIKKEDFLSGRCFVKAKMTFDKDQLAQKKKQIAPLKNKSVSEGPKPSDIQVPEKSYLITDQSNPDLFPVYIDAYLNENMRAHQRQGVKFMFECISGLRGSDIGGCILAVNFKVLVFTYIYHMYIIQDSMGLGKTLQTIALIWTLIRRSPYSATQPMIKKAVVVAPVSLLGSWRKEVKKWLGDERLVPKIALGNRDKVKIKFEANIIQICKDFSMSAAKMLLISYEQFRMHVETLSNSCDLLIFDEGHRLKNMNIKTFKSFNSIKCNKRIILTGTPLQNSLDEFYSCVKFVNPNIFDNEKQFKFVFSNPILAALKSDATPQMVENASNRSKELTNIISKFVLRRKADILEKLLPPRSEYFIFLRMTPIQIMLYKKMIQLRYNKNEFNTENGAFSLLTIMRKLLNHPQLIYQDEGNLTSLEFKQYFPPDFQLDDWEASLKFKFVSDVLNQMKMIEQKSKSIERIIIVSYWTQTLDVIQNMIQQKNLKYVRLDGSVNAQKRQELIDRFQDQSTEIRVFLLCGKAGGTGLNLSAANRMILLEADWNPSNDLQVMGRIWRDGQTKPVHIYRLVSCGTMEEKVLQRQFLKEDLSQNVVDEKMIVQQHNSDKLKQLFEFKGDDKCLSFKEDENQLSELSQFTPDYTPEMSNYITFVKRTIKGEKKENENEQEDQPQNEFDQGNVFLKHEIKEEEEDPIIDQDLNEEDEEKYLEELEKNETTGSTGTPVSDDINKTNEEDKTDQNDKEDENDDIAAFNIKKKDETDQIDIISKKETKQSKTQKEKEQDKKEQQNEKEMVNENNGEEQEQKEQEEASAKGRRGRRKAAQTPENPAKNILKKLKK